MYVKTTPKAVSVMSVKMDSMISKPAMQLDASHVTVFLMAPQAGIFHVTEHQDSVTAKIG